MKFWSRFLFSGVLAVATAVVAFAQQQPVLTVSITGVSVLSGTGEVSLVLVSSGGSGYTSAPAVTISGGGGSGATAVATVNTSGQVASITITNGGSGYTSAPTITIDPPAPPSGFIGTTATAVVYLGSAFPQPTQHESYGPAGTSIGITALAVGTFPADGFEYEFFVNGISIGVASGRPPAGSPSTIGWTPPQPGSYFLTVTATDGANTATSLPVRYFATGTIVNSPLNNTLVPAGSSVVLKADATVAQGFIKQIQFYDGGVPIGSADTTIPYSLIYTPSGPAGTVHNITAQATDNDDNPVTVSSPIAIKVVNAIPSLPTCAISSPTHNSGIAIPTDPDADIAVTVDASSPAGRISKVELYIDGELFGTDITFPYSFEWHPTVVGTYRLVALAYDDKNNVVASTTSVSPGSTPEPTLVRVAAPPTVTVTSPSNGATVAGGVSVQLTANATDSNPGVSVSSVQFFVDDTFVGVATTPSSNNTYSVTTTLTRRVLFGEPVPSVIKAMAISSFDISAVSSGVSVNVTEGGSDNGDGPDPGDDDDGDEGGAVNSETFYSGTYQSTTETGRVTIADLGGDRAMLIGYTSGANPRVYFYSGIEVDATGAFSLVSDGTTSVSGTFSDTGATGSFDSGRLNFIVPVNLSGGSSVAPSGVYSGALLGRSSSALTAIVSPDGSLTVHIADGSYSDAGSGALASGGTFNLTLLSGARLAGTITPTSGFMSATLSGGTVTGTVAAALATGGGASDGTLRNISTRGLVSSGDNVLIAGFIVSGSTPKPVLIRAIGPSLAPLGVTDVVSNPRLDLFSGSTIIAGNDNWGGDATVATEANRLHAFELNPASLDAAIYTTLAPGPYTVHVTGVSGSTGVGLVEIYDGDTATAFTSDKVINVSTRGRVESGERILIAGFVVNGSSSKRVLVRAVGPGLSALGVSGVLADPLLRIMKQDGTLVRENDNWETGNDAALVADVASQIGAFSLATGSKDSVVLMTLPPGVYTAQVSIGSGSAGVALVEVYEVP